MSKETYDRMQKLLALVSIAAYSFVAGVGFSRHDAALTGLFVAATIFCIGLANRK